MPTPRPETPEDAPREPNTGRTFSQKFAIYLTGVAIGLMFYGWTQARKNMATRRQQAQQMAEQPETHPADTTSDNLADLTQKNPG